MTWAKIDDRLHANPKIRRLWTSAPEALGLHLLAISYCADQLTDGVVDREFVDEKLAHILHRSRRDVVTKSLRRCGLWRDHPDGFQINDWLEYNPSREDVLAERAANARRQAEWRAQRHGVSNAVTDAVTSASSNAMTNSAPTRPVLKEEKDQREREERRPPVFRRPPSRMGGPTHDEANAAALSWQARKRDLEDGAE